MKGTGVCRPSLLVFTRSHRYFDIGSGAVSLFIQLHALDQERMAGGGSLVFTEGKSERQQRPGTDGVCG